MAQITHKECPLCGSTKMQPQFSCTDQFATGEEFAIYKCEECSFTFTQNIPDEEEIGRYYESPTYISHSNTNKGLINRIYQLVRKRMLQKKAKLVKQLTLLEKGKLLDYGAGTGHFARVMAAKGWDVTAIEKSDKARELALKDFGFEMCPVEALAKIEDKRLDVVTMWHVMEHIQNPDNLWKELHRILNDTGVAIIAVPNSISYDAQKYQEHWAAYDVPRHLWHFTPSTIMRWGEKHGFLLEKQYRMPFDGFYISILSEQNKNSRLHAVKGFWNGFKGWIAQCRKSSASSSIIYVFRKKR